MELYNKYNNNIKTGLERLAITSTAHFVAQYTVPEGNTLRPASDEIFTIIPLFLSNIFGKTAAIPFNTPLIFTSTCIQCMVEREWKDIQYIFSLDCLYNGIHSIVTILSHS